MKPLSPVVRCQDGTSFSMQASRSHYCSPRDDNGPYYSVEIGHIADPDGNPRKAPRSWKSYKVEGVEVYGWVPTELVGRFCEAHGGALADPAIPFAVKTIV